jgi:hypothetical protein
MDGGATWADHRFIGGDGAFQTNVGIASDGRRVWTIVTEKDVDAPVGTMDNDVVLYTSRDRGFTWSRRELNEENPEGYDAYPIIAYERGCLFAFWDDDVPGVPGFSGRLVARHSRDGGATWSGQIEVASADALPGDLITWRGRLMLAFTTNELYPDVHVTQSTDGGTTWSESELVSGDLPDWYRSRKPQFAAFRDDLRIVWWDDLSDFNGIEAVYDQVSGQWHAVEVPELVGMYQMDVLVTQWDVHVIGRYRPGLSIRLFERSRVGWILKDEVISPEGYSGYNPFLLDQGHDGLRAFWSWLDTPGFGHVHTSIVAPWPRFHAEFWGQSRH